MVAVSYSAQARLDLADIWAWIAESGGEATADRVVGRIERRIAALSLHPELGPARPDIADEARLLVAERWLALYAIAGDGVRIVRIVDGAVDLRRIGWHD